MRRLLSGGLLAIVCGIMLCTEVDAKYVYYTNEVGVEMTELQYEKMLKLYSAKYVSYMSQDEFDLYKDVNIISSEAVYYKTTYENGIAVREETITEEEYNAAPEGAVSDGIAPLGSDSKYVETSYKKLNGTLGDNGNGTYTIDADKWGEFFVKSAVGKYGSKGFYTSTYDTATNKVWAVEYTLNSTKDKITAMTVKQVSMVDEGAYAYLPVVSFDKSYDCHTRVSIEEMACYSCDDDYKWLTVGTQAPTCTLIEDIKSKGTCVKSVKTGVEDYIVEFVAVALVCGIALVVVKRKELFRGI